MRDGQSERRWSEVLNVLRSIREDGPPQEARCAHIDVGPHRDGAMRPYSPNPANVQWVSLYPGATEPFVTDLWRDADRSSAPPPANEGRSRLEAPSQGEDVVVVEVLGGHKAIIKLDIQPDGLFQVQGRAELRAVFEGAL